MPDGQHLAYDAHARRQSGNEELRASAGDEITNPMTSNGEN